MSIFSSEAKIPNKLKRTRHTAAKQATRDEKGRFARKGFFTGIFDGIERAVTGVKRVHRKVSRVRRTFKRAFASHPRQVSTAPRRRRRARKKSAAQGRIPHYRKRVMRGLFR